MIDSKTRLIALIGYPSRHSLSPLIHNCFIKENNKNAAYVVFEFKPGKLADAFNGMKAMGFVGFNVTMPYKEEIFEMVDAADETSTGTRSVNTVKITSGSAEGFNTDVQGFVQAAEDKGWQWKGNSLVIGAGGAARSSIYGLLKKPVNRIYVYNRTIEKAKNIKTLFKINDRIEIIKDLNDLSGEDISFIVNCTPMGMALDKDLKNKLPVPGHWHLGGKHVMEMVYKPVHTPLVKKAVSEGAEVINGIEMLISQAASSFKIWFDMDSLPKTAGVRSKIQNLLETGGINES
ncbi:MAG: shikimate dehydrogenase [Actinomycetota bacterium]